MQAAARISQYDVEAIRAIVKRYDDLFELEDSEKETLQIFRRETRSLSLASIEHSSSETELVHLRDRVKKILKGDASRVANRISVQGEVQAITGLEERRSKIEIARIAIDSRFYPQALRELAMRKTNGLWLYDEDIINSLTSRKHDTFSVVVEANKTWFINYDENDKDFIDTLKKYAQLIPEEFDRYIAPNVPKVDVAPHTKPQLKPEHSHSSPLLKTLRSSATDLHDFETPKIRKSSAPTLQQGVSGNVSDMNMLMKVPSRFMENPLVFAKFVALYAVLDESVFRFYQEDISEFVKALREGAWLAQPEFELLKEAKKMHGSKLKSMRLFSRRSATELEISSKSLIKALAPDVKSKVIEYIVVNSLEDPDFLLKIFKSFGSQMGIEAGEFFNELLQLERAHDLFSAENRKLGNSVMQVLQLCFDVPEYYPNADEISVWVRLFMQYLHAYKAIPDFFCASNTSIKFSSILNKEDMDAVVAAITTCDLSKKLCKRVYNRLAVEQDAGLALKLLTSNVYGSVAALAQTTDQTKYFLSLLMIRSKAVDFTLLAKPEFREFIQEQRATALGCLLYDQLLERVKRAFYYENLPEGYSDVRQTQDGRALLERNRERVNQAHNFVFLSFSEITHIFMTLKPINRLKLGEMWLETYKTNLSLILKHFFPHLPRHLAEVSQVYKEYRACTIGITASTDNDRYDHNRHMLKFFPECVVQYIKTNPSDLELFQSNLQTLEGIYKKMDQYATVRMNDKEMLGFISIERVAEEILKSLPPNAHKFTQWSLSALLSKRIMGAFAKKFQDSMRPRNLYADKTMSNICENEQLLWFKSYLLPSFVELLGNIVARLKKHDDRFSDNSFTEAHVNELVAAFCEKSV